MNVPWFSCHWSGVLTVPLLVKLAPALTVSRPLPPTVPLLVRLPLLTVTSPTTEPVFAMVSAPPLTMVPPL